MLRFKIDPTDELSPDSLCEPYIFKPESVSTAISTVTDEKPSCTPVIHSKRLSRKQKLLPCILCGKTFSTLNQLELHRGEYCTNEFSIHSELQPFVRLVTSHTDYIPEIVDDNKLKLSPFKEDTKPIGNDCSTVLSSIAGYQQTNKTVDFKAKDENQSSLVDVSDNLANKKQQGISKSKEPFVCCVCDEICYTAVRLSQHKAQFHKQKKDEFECSYCEMSFPNGYRLKSHMRRHTGERPYACSLCEQKFTQRSHRYNHMRTHTGERPFVCRECSATFAQTSHLKRHMLLHTGERPYGCTICEKGFTTNCKLKKHIEIHRKLGELADA